MWHGAPHLRHTEGAGEFLAGGGGVPSGMFGSTPGPTYRMLGAYSSCDSENLSRMDTFLPGGMDRGTKLPQLTAISVA